MSNWEELARWSVVRKWLAERLAVARREDPAAHTLPVGTRLPVKLDGELAGMVSIPKPRVTVSVTDAGKFLRWVEEHRPDEIETVRVVRQSYADAIRRSVRERGGWLNPETGEIEDVPGLEADQGSPTVTVSLTAEADDVIARAWRNGEISPASVLPLEAGES